MFQCKVTQAQNPYWFILWSCCIEARSVRLQDLDFEKTTQKSYKEKERKTYVPLISTEH
jgi:hypothetical protein